MIRGEYWIVDGSVEFADGDVGDYNHEAIATNHVFQQWASSVQKIAEEYEIETEFETYGELNTEAVSEAIQETTIFFFFGSFHKLNVAANTLAQTLIKDEVDIFDLTEIGAA